MSLDTLKTVVKRDTLITHEISPSYKMQRQTSVETITYPGKSDCWLNLCNCKLLSDLLWPLTILIIVLIFQKQFKSLIVNILDRIKRGDNLKVGPSGIELSQALSNQEINDKAEQEFESVETIKESPDNIEPVVRKEEFVPKYLNIERKVFEAFMKYFYPKYKILSNRRIHGYEFDLIIETNNFKEYDYIIEIKYFPYKFSKVGLQNIAIKLSFLKQIYVSTVKREAKPILLIVLNKNLQFTYIDEINQYLNQPLKDKEYISLSTIQEYEIDSLDENKILNLLT